MLLLLCRGEKPRAVQVDVPAVSWITGRRGGGGGGRGVHQSEGLLRSAVISYLPSHRPDLALKTGDVHAGVTGNEQQFGRSSGFVDKRNMFEEGVTLESCHANI